MFGLFRKNNIKDVVEPETKIDPYEETKKIPMIDMGRKKKIDMIPASIYNLFDNRAKFMCKYILKYPFIYNLNEIIHGKVTVFTESETGGSYEYNILLEDGKAYIEYSYIGVLNEKHRTKYAIENEVFRDVLLDEYLDSSNKVPIDLYWLNSPIELFFGRLWILKENKEFRKLYNKPNDNVVSNYIKSHRATIWGNIEFMERENPIITRYDINDDGGN